MSLVVLMQSITNYNKWETCFASDFSTSCRGFFQSSWKNLAWKKVSKNSETLLR